MLHSREKNDNAIRVIKPELMNIQLAHIEVLVKVIKNKKPWSKKILEDHIHNLLLRRT